LHGRISQSKDECDRAGWNTNTAECRFSLMKRAVFGAYHSVSEAHLKRYLVEWDNTRKIRDGQRAALAIKRIEGKRLTYRPTH
jgi:hypothetical protein